MSLDYIKALPETSTLDELIEQVAAGGWHVGNLFEIRAGFWRANLYHITSKTVRHSEFADGKTPNQALTAAIFNMNQARNKSTRGVKSLSNSDVLGSYTDIVVTNPISVKQEAYLILAIQELIDAIKEENDI